MLSKTSALAHRSARPREEKPKATMQPRKLPVASGTWPSIRWRLALTKRRLLLRPRLKRRTSLMFPFLNQRGAAFVSFQSLNMINASSDVGPAWRTFHKAPEKVLAVATFIGDGVNLVEPCHGQHCCGHCCRICSSRIKGVAYPFDLWPRKRQCYLNLCPIAPTEIVSISGCAFCALSLRP